MDEAIVLTPEETARALRVGRSKVYLLFGQGLPHIRVGRRGVRVPLDALRRWVAEQEQSEEKVRQG